MSMETQAATKSATGTSLTVAIALLLASGGLAYMAGGANLAGTDQSGYGLNPNSCSLSQFSVSEACEKTYRGTKVRCYDGKTITVNSCATGAEARAMCDGHCKGSKCGVDNYSQGSACEQQYKKASGVCSDGTSAGDISGDCRTASSLRGRMENTCAAKYCGPVPNGQLTLQIADDSPVQRLVAVGNSNSTEVPVLKFKASASVEDVQISKLTFLYDPITVNNEIPSFRTLKLFDITTGNETSLGEVTMLPSGVATFNLSPAIVVTRNQMRNFVLKATFNGIMEGTTSAMSPFVRLGNGIAVDTQIVAATGVTSGSTLPASSINGDDTVNITGNQVVLYKSFPIFTYVDVGSSLTNGIEQNIYGFKVRAKPEGSVSLKQLKFSLDVGDNAGVNPLALTNFKLFKGNTDISNTVYIHRGSDGTLLSSPTLNGTVTSTVGVGTSTIFYVTWRDEEIIPEGTDSTYYIKSGVSGFTSSQDHDFIRVRLLDDEYANGELNQTIDPYYTIAGNGWQRYLVMLADAGRHNVTPASIIWSDRSSIGHGAVRVVSTNSSNTSTPDWFNGFLMDEAPLNYSILVR